MSHKVDRALYGPSWTEIIIGALLSVIVGAVLGVAVLIFKPVLKVSEIPKDAPSGQLYYIPGAGSSSTDDIVTKKEKDLVAGKTVDFEESDLITMFTPTDVKSAKPAIGGKVVAPDKFLTLGAPDFKIKAGTMQVAAPLTFSLYGMFTPVIIQAKGTFEKEDGVYTFVPSTVYVGSLPLDRIPFAQHLLKLKVMSAVSLPDDFKEAWSRLGEVAFDGATVKAVPAH